MLASGVCAEKYDIEHVYAENGKDGVAVKKTFEEIGYKRSEPAESGEKYEACLEAAHRTGAGTGTHK